VRMGINTWEAVLGNIWAPGKKLEFTALWNSVNIASRLEWVNKIYGTYICVSQSVYEECLDFFEFRELDTVILKWKKTPMKVYELIDEIEKVRASDLQVYQKYNKWLTMYYEENYVKARKIFKSLEEIDTPSKVMLHKCSKMLKK
jgi:adenylate cyclase